MNSKKTGLLALTLLAVLSFVGCPKPVAPVKPFGVTQGVRGVVLSCSTRAVDQNAGQVSYQFDWGDNSQSAWSAYMDAALVSGDTHTYAEAGQFKITARMRASGKSGASAWSDGLTITVVAEGAVIWSFGYAWPDDPEDSADFSGSTIGLAPNGSVAISTDFGLVFKPKSGGTFAFTTPDLDAFAVAPAFNDSGYLFIGCDNDTFYCLKPNVTRSWGAQGTVSAPAALGADGAVFYQADDSLIARNADGTRRWAAYTGGSETQPVIARDGTVIAITDVAGVLAFDQASGTQKWSQVYAGRSVFSSSAINPDRNELYVPLDDGSVAALDLGANGDQVWHATGLGADPSGLVVGLDGLVYVGAGGKLIALDPAANGAPKWTFAPALAGSASTPAVASSGIVYFVVGSSKRVKLVGPDSLYGVNSDGSQRWACALGEGGGPDIMSAPKLDDNGLIYVGSGVKCWCVGGNGGPGAAAWPMYGRDARNSGRAR